MEIAVLSDIHGNYIALEKCIEYAVKRNINTFIFLGDYVGEFAYPQKTMQIIEKMRGQYKCYFIRGNKEDYWLDYHEKGEVGWRENDSTTGSLLYAYNCLQRKDLAFFKKLPFSSVITVKNMPQITICHGSPYRVNEKLLSNSERTYQIMEEVESSLIVCGHTHIQNKIEYKNKMVLNAGSVGIPLGVSGKAQFLVLQEEGKMWRPEFISLSYDVEQVIQELYDSGLNQHAPYWCEITRSVLKRGAPSHNKVLAKAIELCKEERGECIWPDIPKRYWEKATSQMLSF